MWKDYLLAFVALLALAVLVASFQPTLAQQPQCNTRDSVLRQLEEKYGETPVAVGVTHNGGLLEVIAGDKATWSIIITSPQGMSCLVEAGEGWRMLEQLSPKGDGV